MARIYQQGTAKDFFTCPPVTLKEIKHWIADWGAPHEKANGIGLGAVVNGKNEIIGEMIMPGGSQAFMVTPDGKPVPLNDDARIVFAQVAHLEPEHRFSLAVHDTADLQRQLHELLPPEEEGNYIVRIRGRVSDITFRSVDTQNKNVHTMAELLKNQTKFVSHNPDGFEMIGIYSRKGAVPEGTSFDDTLHIHGIDENHRRVGGHLLDFTGSASQKLDVEVMPITEWLVSTRKKAQDRSSSGTFQDRLRGRAEESLKRGRT